jgi:hypothetical protein|uniref:Uncharacterized protein n=1 Tax=Zea mays TaxID=4577 RepID=C4IZY2_MAIZE|nr:unknown [Zea mays]
MISTFSDLLGHLCLLEKNSIIHFIVLLYTFISFKHQNYFKHGNNLAWVSAVSIQGSSHGTVLT